jgi:hypothetical protein
MKTLFAPYVLGASLALSFVAAPAQAAVRVSVGVVTPAVPPPDVIPEDRPVTPGPGYHWVPGYWDWTGADWVWEAGYWSPPRAGYVYVAPRYVREGDHFVYHRAYWYGPHGYREYAYGGRRSAPPPVAWRAHPRYAPQVWRREHREAEHRAAAHRAAVEHQTAERNAQRAVEHSVAERRTAEHDLAVKRAAERRAVDHREALRREAPRARR